MKQLSNDAVEAGGRWCCGQKKYLFADFRHYADTFRLFRKSITRLGHVNLSQQEMTELLSKSNASITIAEKH